MATALVPAPELQPPDFSDKRKGRAKGVQHHYTRNERNKVAAAFVRLGGVPALVEWARHNPTEFYTRIWAKLVPMELTGKDGGPIQMEHGFTIKWGDQEVHF